MNIMPCSKPNLSAPIKALIFVFTCAFLLAAQPAIAAKHAAKVIYSFGDVKAVGKSGSRGLAKGDLVFSGETVATTRGRAQIKFTDGGFASLQPNTDYQIDDYNFEGKADGNERSFLNLLKGSVRLVTGVIGKANRRNFRIKTAVATIGIRGTQGTLTHDPITNTTSLRGHGGEWDLESGNFSGGVPAGQAFSCDGVSCTQVAGVRQRADVGRGGGKAQRRQRGYQQGQQTDPDGRICDLGGACDELAVKVDQVGAVAFTDNDGEVTSGGTEFLEQLGVVTIGDKPVALVADATTDNEPGGGFVTTDVEALRTAVNTFAEEDSEFVTEANEFLDELDPTLVAELEANPATVAEEDFGTTPDGLITFGRWIDGNVLFAAKGFETGNVMQRLELLENFKSVHFIYGDTLESIEFTGTGIYTLTGATYPTAIDGSSMGLMPTSGSITWNFTTASGSLLLPVVFDGIVFSITGSLQAPDAADLNDPNVSRIFTDDSIAAVYTMGGSPMSAAAHIDGFFTGNNGANAPLAAGLTYAVDYYSNPFVGAAAFGLAAQQSFIPETTIKYAVNFLDMGGFPGAITDGDQFPMGTPISNFMTSFGDTFNQGDASILDAGSDAETGAHFRRFSTGFTFTSSSLPIGSTPESFHAVKTDYTTPDAVIASTTGTRTFSATSPTNATSPTILFDSGSFTYVENTGTLTAATFSANFTTGMMDSINIAGNFATPIVAFNLSGGGVGINSGTAPISGTCTGSDCTGGGFSGTVNYAFTSATAGGPPVGVISSFNASGTVNFGAANISGVAISK